MSAPQSPYITCRELLDFLYDYVEGTLPAPTLFEFERHLAVCPSCVNYLASYRHTRTIGRLAHRPDEDGADLPEALVQSILAARRASQPA